MRLITYILTALSERWPFRFVGPTCTWHKSGGGAWHSCGLLLPCDFGSILGKAVRIFKIPAMVVVLTNWRLFLEGRGRNSLANQSCCIFWFIVVFSNYYFLFIYTLEKIKWKNVNGDTEKDNDTKLITTNFVLVLCDGYCNPPPHLSNSMGLWLCLFIYFFYWQNFIWASEIRSLFIS